MSQSKHLQFAFSLWLALSVLIGSLNAECCQDGEQKIDEDDCTKYYVCCSGKFVQKSCDSGDWWNWASGECEQDNGQCNGSPTCTEGELQEDPTDCAGYLKCVNGSLVSQKCLDQSYFNVNLGVCTPDTDGVCVGCVEGSTEADSTDCTKYKLCSGGKLVSKSCGTGNYWNAEKSSCEKDNGECNGSPSCTEGELQEDPTDCAGYLKCVNGNLVSQKCLDQSYFNVNLGVCTPDTDGVCVGCVEGSTEADSTDCTKYKLCSGGKLVSKSCPSGNYWNAEKSSCEKDNGECNGSPSCTEGELDVNAADCAGYLECIHGSLVARKCPDLNYFNATQKKCIVDTEGVCISKVCDPECCDKPNNWIGPVDKNCSAFTQCVYGNKFEQTCPNNLQFNPLTLDCDFPENVNCEDGSAPPSGPNAGPSGTYCESQGRCVGQRDGTMFGDASNKCSSAYVVCQCECEVDFNCSNGLLYNPLFKVCDWPANVEC
ncbi:blast:Peritrophin-44 [Drosophila guanche]|nr:blast:Peritrophin-44 [Drosophila guanche]